MTTTTTDLKTQFANDARIPSLVRWMAEKAEMDSYNDLRWTGRFKFDTMRKAYAELQAAAERGVGGYHKSKKPSNPADATYKLEVGNTMALVEFLKDGRVSFITITD